MSRFFAAIGRFAVRFSWVVVAAWIVAIRLISLRKLVMYIFNKGWVSSNP